MADVVPDSGAGGDEIITTVATMCSAPTTLLDEISRMDWGFFFVNGVETHARLSGPLERHFIYTSEQR